MKSQLLFFKVACICWLSCITLGYGLDLNDLKLPPGFAISLYAKEVNEARSLALGEKNTIFVGNRESDAVYALVPDSSNFAKSPKVIKLLSKLNTPNGIAFYEGALYVAENDRILKYDKIENNLEKPPAPTVVIDKLPNKSHHGWRYIAFGPDKKLYIAIGAPCNVCLENDSRFSTIMRLGEDLNDFEIYAKGIRNTVGFDWDPVTKNLWFTENGRDLLGDDIPPDELNYAPTKGMDFGFPYCHGKNILDPEFGKKRSCAEFTAPKYQFGAHVAALGMRFYTGNQFPKEYKNAVFVAQHGSWNRTKPSGYQVMVLKLNDKRDTVVSAEPFITGWLKNEKFTGRPVDLLFLPDGSMLLSDDYNGVIYRITYKAKGAPKSRV